MDHRIGPHFLKASVGFGGSCFQKDILNLVYLYKFYGLDEVAEYWYQVVKINDYQKDRFAQKIINHFGGDLTMKRIAVLGWAFKANTNDSRESAAIYVAEKLYNVGATLEIYDPMVSKDAILKDINIYWKNTFNNIEERIRYKKNLTILKQFDAIAILTDWQEFRRFDFKSSKVFDGRNLLDENKSNVIYIGK